MEKEDSIVNRHKSRPVPPRSLFRLFILKRPKWGEGSPTFKTNLNSI